jgi:hypothetical protein
MKLTKITLALIAFITLGVASEGVFAYGHGGGHGGWHGGGHGGGHIGVYFGGPFGWPGYYGGYPYAPYYSPYYGSAYYPPVASTEPTTYIEQEQDQAQAAPEQAPSAASWYYCAASKTYYPYVKQCSSPWQQVAPQPAP